MTSRQLNQPSKDTFTIHRDDCKIRAAEVLVCMVFIHVSFLSYNILWIWIGFALYFSTSKSARKAYFKASKFLKTWSFRGLRPLSPHGDAVPQPCRGPLRPPWPPETFSAVLQIIQRNTVYRKKHKGTLLTVGIIGKLIIMINRIQ